MESALAGKLRIRFPDIQIELSEDDAAGLLKAQSDV